MRHPNKKKPSLNLISSDLVNFDASTKQNKSALFKTYASPFGQFWTLHPTLYHLERVIQPKKNPLYTVSKPKWAIFGAHLTKKKNPLYTVSKPKWAILEAPSNPVPPWKNHPNKKEPSLNCMPAHLGNFGHSIRINSKRRYLDRIFKKNQVTLPLFFSMQTSCKIGLL